MRIVAVSYGAPETTKPWVVAEKFPFEVWTDSDRTLAKAFGASGGLMPARVTVLLDAQGRVVVNYPSVDVSVHPEEVLEDAKILFPAPR